MGNAIISRREQRELKKTQENYDFEEKLLPEELKSCTTKYTCFLPNGDVLISGYGEDIGIWHFEKESRSFYKLYNEGYWSTFQLLTNGDCLIVNKSDSEITGILFYNSSEKSITKIYDEGYKWEYFYELSNGMS